MIIEHTEHVSASPEEVWQRCGDPVLLGRFLGPEVEVSGIDPDAPLQRGSQYRVLVRVGSALVGGDVIVLESAPPRELTWTAFSGISHRVRLRIRPAPGGATVHLRLSFDAPGILGTAADLVAYPQVWRMVRGALREIRATVEGGQDHLTQRSLPHRLLSEVAHGAVLARAGIISPMRPDRLARVALAARTWGLTPGALVAIGAARHPSREVMIDELGSLTYAEADRDSNALAAGLIRLGVAEGDAVALLARNHRGFLIATAAVGKLGCDLLLLNTGFSGPQIADVCRREHPTALIHDAEFEALIADATTSRLAVLCDGPPLPGPAPTVAGLAESFAGSTPPPPGRAGRVTILTSGTTGTPKGAARGATSGGNLPTLEAPAALLDRIPLRTGMRVGLAAPVFHTWGLANLLLTLALGGTAVCVRKFDPQDWLAAIARHRVQALAVVPVMLQRILDLPAPARSAHDTSTLAVVAASGSAVPGELSTRWMDAFGDNLYNVYGSTEVANATIATPSDLRTAPGTAGRPTRGTSVVLLDDVGAEVRQGSVGRIFVGNSQLFEGYTGGGDKARVRGLMSTGDVGRFDTAGRLFVAGRDDDMIVSGGENVFPREVEDTLITHPSVREAACIGVPDPRYGQRLRAFVVTVEGSRPSEEELRGLVRAQLAGYKVPREVVFLAELPRNATGKVLKRDLPTG